MLCMQAAGYDCLQPPMTVLQKLGVLLVTDGLLS
jgi:hypothetical protein